MAKKPASEYRKAVIARHREAFQLHQQTASTIGADLFGEHAFPTHVEMVVHMLAVQAYKAHSAVSLLSQHGLWEESAASCRRLLELTIQAIFIGQESDPTLRRRRAGQFAAYLWRQLPRKAKQRLPPEIRAPWTSLGRGYGRFIRRKNGWGPSLHDMFRDCGHLDLYRSDYKFLSSITHGTADSLVFQFSTTEIRVHDDRFASTLLIYASRYLLVGTDPWRTVFGVETSAAVTAAGEALADWDFSIAGPASAS